MSDPAEQRPDVLVVDDDPTALLWVCSLLSEAGYRALSVSSGSEALRVAPMLRPRLLILDVSMPELDGYHVCRRLRADSSTAQLPILFLSSAATVDSKVNGLKAGGVDYLAKPFEPAELLARVNAHLEVARLREELSCRNQELSNANRALRAGVTAARRIQNAMLPRTELLDGPARFAWRCRQCDTLGGDAVNVLKLSADSYLVYILDASGHGLSASLLAVASGYFVSALAGNLLTRDSSQRLATPGAILDDVNRVLCEMVPPGTFVTMLVGVVDTREDRFTFASAGHPGPVLFSSGRDPQVLDRPATPAGIGPWQYADYSVDFRPGDRIALYSDGICEQRGLENGQFGRDRILQSLTKSAGGSCKQALGQLVYELDQWRGTRPMDDDASLLVIDHARDRDVFEETVKDEWQGVIK